MEFEVKPEMEQALQHEIKLSIKESTLKMQWKVLIR